MREGGAGGAKADAVEGAVECVGIGGGGGVAHGEGGRSWKWGMGDSAADA